MYENVVMAYLLERIAAMNVQRRRETEEEFYRRFSDPAPGWFVSAIRLLTGRQDRKSGIEAASEWKRPLQLSRKAEPEVLRWHRLRLPKA